MSGRLTSIGFIVAGLLMMGVYLFLLRPDPAAMNRSANESPAEPQEEQGEFLTYTPPENLPVEETAPARPLPPPSKHAIPGEYTVMLSDEAALEAFMKAAEAAGMEVLGTLSRFHAVRLRGSGSQLAALLTDEMEVDLNYRMEVPSMPDPDLWQSGTLAPFNAGALDFLGVPEGGNAAWGAGVTVAILDTGWNGHSAVLGARVREIDLIGGSREGDYSGHGTAVAGLIASTSDFAPGIAPGSDVLSLRVLDGSGQGDSFTLAEAIVLAVDNGARVINMSLGGYGDSQIMRQAVAYAAESGVALVAATGNDGIQGLTYPAAYPSVIGVTAVDASGNRTPFSNFGEGVDIGAPGYQIHALWNEEEFVYFNGTSASAPLVSGMVARLLESGQAVDAASAREILLSQANETGPPGDDFQYGAGLLNAERIESAGQAGIFDAALADLYPATEESDGITFPLYVTLENRGTEFLPSTTLEISVEGTPYFYKFSGMDLGAVETVQLPVPVGRLQGETPFAVSAKVVLPDNYKDSRPQNDSGGITLQKIPDE